MIITPETFFDGECRAVNLLFEKGMESLHIRKPGSSTEDLRRFLRQINAEYHPRLILNECYELANEFKLRGVHLNSRSEYVPRVGGSLTVGRSCHTFNDVLMSRKYDYVFLSPIFDSVSKIGYVGKFTADELTTAKTEKIIEKRVIALGGITPNRIKEVRRYGFGGVALIGALWKDFSADCDTAALLKRFYELKTKCNQL